MIDYRHDVPLDPREVARVFDAAGLPRPTHDLPRIARMLEGADLVLSAWDGERLVGVCRAITDFAFCCYLSDLAVDGAYQHQGIGRRFLAQVREMLGDEVSIFLLSVPGAVDYYPRVGMERADNAFVAKRKT